MTPEPGPTACRAPHRSARLRAASPAAFVSRTGWLAVMLLLVISLTWSVKQGRGPSVAWEPTYDAALQKARRLHIPLLIDFEAGWCEPCQQMDASTYRDPEVRRLAARFACARVDVDRQPALAQQYGISMLPTAIIASPDASEAERAVGFTDAASFRSILQRALPSR